MNDKKRQKSGGKYQGEQLRSIRKYWFGGRCMWENGKNEQCESTSDLELAHAVDTDLSIAKLSGRSSWERLQDVIEFPERFVLLCRHHHIEFDGRDGIVWSRDFYAR